MAQLRSDTEPDAGVNPAAPLTADKFNAVTPQRPEANRLLDSPLVVMDLHVFRQQIKRESAWHLSDQNAITVFKTAGLRVVRVALQAEVEMKMHQRRHPHRARTGRPRNLSHRPAGGST